MVVADGSLTPLTTLHGTTGHRATHCGVTAALASAKHILREYSILLHPFARQNSANNTAQPGSSVVIDELFLNTRGPSSCAVLFFYFDYSKQVDQTPLRVLQTLLHQLLSTHSYIPPLAREVADDLMLGKPLPSFNDMKDLFVNLCGSGPPVFIVLDALDECDAVDNRKPILKLIETIKDSPARLLVTSRPYPPDVDEVLGDCPQVLVEASDKDIEKYVLEQIEGNVEMRRMLQDEDDLKQMIVKSILNKSQGM